MTAVIGPDWGGSGFTRPTLVASGPANPLFFHGMPVRWADADVQQYPNVDDRLPSQYGVAPGRTTFQGALFGLRFASAMNTALLKLRKPLSGVTIAVPRPTAGDIPNQQPAFLQRTRGMVTPFPAARPINWNEVGGGIGDGASN